jgi:hypothetical protein
MVRLIETNQIFKWAKKFEESIFTKEDRKMAHKHMKLVI